MSVLQEKRAEGDEIIDEEGYLRRLDGGLFTLQTVDYILAWIIMEDDGVCSQITIIKLPILTAAPQIRTHALKILGRKNQNLTDIVRTLQIYHDNIDDESAGNAVDTQESAPLREILQNLINALDTTNGQ